jgi:hypothetical protein
LEEKVAAPGLETRNTAVGIRRKLTLTSLTSGGRSVGIVRSRTQATEFVFPYCAFNKCCVSLIGLQVFMVLV